MKKFLAMSTVILITVFVAGSTLAQTTDPAPTAATPASNAQGGQKARPAAMGKVTDINGTTITLTGQDSKTYTVDASNATVSKGLGDDAKAAVSDIKSGDTITVFGTASDDKITATSITDIAGIAGRANGKNLAATGTGNAAAGGAAPLSALQQKADKEIDNRIHALNAQLKRIGEMVRLSDAQKSVLQTSSQGVISTLTSLKTKIDADTDITTLKQDLQSITKSERVYMLVMPQTALLSAADRINTVALMLSGIQAKIANRVAALPTGTDVTAMNSALTDMKIQIGNAETAAQNANAAVANLKPDNGIQATLTANNAALKGARSQIVAAQKDLQAAQKDARTVLQALKSVAGSAPSTTNTTNQPAPNNQANQ